MQKRLRALMPKDYARDYRRYRPSSRQNARHRLLLVKCCMNGRVKKCRGLCSKARMVGRNESCLREAGSGPDKSELRASAFRNQSRPMSSGPGNYISTALLDLSNIQLHMESNPKHYAVEYTQRIHTLRREAVFGSTSHLAETQFIPHAPSAMAGKSNENAEIFINNDNHIGNAGHQVVRRHGPVQKTDPSSIGGYEMETSSDSLSIRSLGRRLARRYSQSTIEHIASILHSSSTSSRRSSLLSFISFVSSKVSGRVSTDQISWTSENKPGKTVHSGPRFLLRKGKLSLTEGEQRIWEDLIDESQLAQSSREIPSYPEISLLKRGCCGMAAFPSCKHCGFSETHRWAITTVKEPSASVPFPNGLSAEFAHERDHFGNTPLHFVAANATGLTNIGWRTIKWLIHKGANVRARNTSGETFMHVLCREQLRYTAQYAEILQMLAELRFPFSQRDYHGQTLAELFFATVRPRDIPLRDFQIIFSYLLFDINVKYVAELWRQDVNDSDSTKEERSRSARSLAAMVASGYKPLPSFQIDNFWSKRADMSDIVKEVDVNGDSALIYIVKAWREKHDERRLAHIVSSLVSAGAEVHMRDRWGDTALAIAAQRGLRPAVKALLGCGANPNTRNYQARGLLEQARECLRRARHEDRGSRYAMILSCVALLVDYGAKEEPSAFDEFMSPTALAKVNLAPGIV